LCNIHYIEWNLKKTLDLTPWKELPKYPIKIELNTEQGYLSRMKAKESENFSAKNFLPRLRKKQKVTAKIRNQLD
jgi:hypothetical protein